MTVLFVEPQLFVRDLEAALAHYGRLGFETAFVHGDPPAYAQVRREGARLNLRHVETPVFHPDLSATEGDILSATVVTNDPEGLYAAFQGSGVAFHQPLRTEPWGARTFIVADPDGNLVAFAG